MRWRTVAATTLLAGCAVVAPAVAQLNSSETDILAETGKTYRTLGNYLFEGNVHVVVKGPAAPQIQDAPFFVAVGPEGRLRDQVQSSAVGGMIVSDGKETIVFNAALGQYTRRKGRVESVMSQVPNRGVAGTLLARFHTIDDGVISAKRLQDAKVSLEGADRDCYVLEVAYPPSTPNVEIEEQPRTYWIDKQTHLVLKQHSAVKANGAQYGGKIEQQEDITFRRAILEPTLDDSVFVFQPPAGSREVTEFSANPDGKVPTPPLVGGTAIDFTLKDLKGRAHTLKELRGKVVLLDFWATWCGPCRVTMPQVAKIHAAYKERGVEVISINLGEQAAAAGAYMKKNGYLFTTLLDQDRTVAAQYQVNAIPTLVVIDREGTVSDYLVGVHDEAALRDALTKAGIK